MMKTIGLLGGMSWESTALYYQQINQAVQQHLGGLHSAKIIMVSVDFAQVSQLQKQGLWQQAGQDLAQQALHLQQAGADCIVLCTNTMHKVAAEIIAVIDIPFIHIADATAQVIMAEEIVKVGLLGTAFTMQQDFYTGRLKQQGIEVVLPDLAAQEIVHQVIFDELCKGQIRAESKRRYIEIVEALIDQGAQGIILGCTEICMLIGDVEFSVPLFDTTIIHSQAAVSFALSEVNM